MLRLPRLTAFVLALSALATAGCVDKEKCEEAIRVTRDALAKEQPDIARQWRERAWKICNDPATTSALDKEIVDKEAELAKRTADLARQVADAAQQRLHTAAVVWRSFDKLDEKDRTEERLTTYKEKADHMAQGLPPEYAKQVDDFNAKAYSQRVRAVEAAKAAAKK